MVVNKDTYLKQKYYNLKGMLTSKEIILENNTYFNKAPIATSWELFFCNCLLN